MVKEKKISIITICYNEPELEKTCESIVNQTWQDFEWIVVDGGSNKETLDIFEKYKNRINIFISEKDNGRYNAMNKGIKLAKGKYLQFLNAGDYFYRNDVLENIFKDKEYSAGVLYGNEQFLLKNGTMIEEVPQKIEPEYFINATIRHQSSFILKELFDKYGGYDESIKIGADKEKWACFSINNEEFLFLPLVIAVFNLNGISATSSKINKIEREIINQRYYSKEQIEKAQKEKKERLEEAKKKIPFMYKIFSIKNEVYNNAFVKTFTFFGVKIRIMRKMKQK